MSFELLVGPAGSGKTSVLIERARELCAAGNRVWWAGLPNQRSYVYRRATAAGPLLGLEFQTLQQLYYRLLAHAQRLRPLLVATGRLALVGEALREVRGALPSPGEAGLFAAAIAEAKRFGLGPAELPRGDAEVERLQEVFLAYERLKGERWDYDDFRTAALALADEGSARLEADALIVAGLRELGPLDIRLLTRLGDSYEVAVALPEAPQGLRATREFPRPQPEGVSLFRAPNPVTEGRWVLDSLKRDLAEGIDPLDLAVILPRGESVTFEALADEYGVPVMDERTISLAETLPGRILVDLLELPDHPTASRLLSIRELAPLAGAALEEGVTGQEALELIAEKQGLREAWRRWTARLQAPHDVQAIDDWAADLVEHVAEIVEDAQSDELLPWEQFSSLALSRAKEAAVVATGGGFRSWWAALLRESSIVPPRAGGVALLDDRSASGRRFRRAYVMRAVEGSYSTGEREDYFVAEEERVPPAQIVEKLTSSLPERALPRRFAGRNRLLFAELLTCADAVTVTFPEADQGGPLLPEPGLGAVGEVLRLPPVPQGSRLAASSASSFSLPAQNVPLVQADAGLTIEELRGYDECAARYWLERSVRSARRSVRRVEGVWWRRLIEELTASRELTPARLDLLAASYPPAADWLEAHRELLLGLSFGVRLPAEGPGPFALIDAAVSAGREARLYSFVAPGAVVDASTARDHLEERWNELWAAGFMLRHYGKRIDAVRLFVWPVSGDPKEAYEGGIRYPWKRITSRIRRAERAFERLAAGEVGASPGYRCGSCRVRDVCREGAA